MKIWLALAAAAFWAPAYAQHHGPHQHGVASLEVSTEGNLLELRLESPLDSLVGFESAPRTPKQLEAVRSMVERLRRPETLFVPTVAAGCSPGPVKLESEALDPELLKETDRAPLGGAKGEAQSPVAPGVAADPPEVKQTKDKHADLDVAVTFTCTRPEALSGVNVAVFKAFPNLRRIEAQAVTTRGQRAARLTPESSLLRW